MTAEAILEFLSRGWVGTVVGIVGLLAAVLIYFYTRQRARIGVVAYGRRLLGVSDPELPSRIVVTFDGEVVQRVTKSYIFIWNDGEKTIKGENIVRSDHLRIQLMEPGARILQAKIVKRSRDVNQFACEVSPTLTQALLDFVFLDPRDGAAIEIIHTGSKSKLLVTGTIVEIPKGIKEFSSQSVLFESVMRTIIPFGGLSHRISVASLSGSMALFGLLILLYSFWSGDSLLHKAREPFFSDKEVLGFAGLVYMLIGALGLYFFARRYPRTIELDDNRSV